MRSFWQPAVVRLEVGSHVSCSSEKPFYLIRYQSCFVLPTVNKSCNMIFSISNSNSPLMHSGIGGILDCFLWSYLFKRLTWNTSCIRSPFGRSTFIATLLTTLVILKGPINRANSFLVEPFLMCRFLVATITISPTENATCRLRVSAESFCLCWAFCKFPFAFLIASWILTKNSSAPGHLPPLVGFAFAFHMHSSILKGNNQYLNELNYCK